jgi:hypothetical protein
MAEPGLVVENREHLWNLLIQAAQLEHLILVPVPVRQLQPENRSR